MQAVSPSFKNLGRFVKLPLILTSVSAGMFSGSNIFYFKILGELIDLEGSQAFTETVLYLVLVPAVIGAILQCSFLNLVMKKFNQMESIPIYLSAVILSTTFAGLFILQEA